MLNSIFISQLPTINTSGCPTPVKNFGECNMMDRCNKTNEQFV